MRRISIEYGVYSRAAFIRERNVFKIQFIRYPLHDPSPKDVMWVYASSTSELQLSHLSLVHSEFPTEIAIEAMIVHCYKAVLPCGSESYRLATRPRGSTRILSLERDFLMTSAEKSRVHCKIVLPGGRSSQIFSSCFFVNFHGT